MKTVEVSGFSWKTGRSGDAGPMRPVRPQPLRPSPQTPTSYAVTPAAPPHPAVLVTLRSLQTTGPSPTCQPAPGQFLQGHDGRHFMKFFLIPHNSVVLGSGLPVTPLFPVSNEKCRTPESQRSAIVKVIRHCCDARACGHRTSPTEQGTTDQPGITKLRLPGTQGTTCTLVAHSRALIHPLQICGGGMGEPKLVPHH